MSRYHDRVVVVRASLGEPGRNGVRARDWSAAQRSQPLAASVQPQAADEDAGGRQTTVTSWRLFAGPATDLLPTDRIEWDGVLDETTGQPAPLEVDGEVARWRHRGVPHHVEAVLRRVTS
ncbi:hypothetical protein WDZ16_12960 [Pseudokineococcus marinus]|uniref:Head-to-tail stopper n=1 Tax=Pseudokineococcus marinus TaxID=351215 RepID=A0A849BLX8_9ACTN|nr:hypothetical protein [Pseudokineococcus marinus]NNH21644.1 hypothetical protein [Pseudokineococcus marinus]